jgi:hypothetical protein
MKPLNIFSEAHGQKRPGHVIGFSDQLWGGRRRLFAGDVTLLAKVLENLVRIEWQDDFLAAILEKRERIRKMAGSFAGHRPRAASETCELLSQAEKTRRRPKLRSQAKFCELFRTPEVVKEGGGHGIL